MHEMERGGWVHMREGKCMRGRAGEHTRGRVHAQCQHQWEHQGSGGGNDGSVKGGSGDTMWPPSPFLLFILLVILLVIFTYEYVHNIF